MPELAFVGFGSNLGDRAAHLAAGLEALAAHPGVQVLVASSVYASAPVGYLDQPEFLNGVVLLRSELEAPALLQALQRVEAARKRRRERRWGPRTLDLDLLLFGRLRCCSAVLQVPHPRLLQRLFALVPLLEVAPDVHHPGTGLPMRRHLLASGSRQALRRLGPFPR